MVTRSTKVDVLTSSHRIVGQVGVTTGVLNVLADHTTSFMDIHDAAMGRISLGNTLGQPVPQVRVVRSQILAVCLDRREDIGPQAGPRPAYGRSFRYTVRLTTPIYEMEGTLDWPGRFDFSIMMKDGTCDFIALYDASLGAIHIPELLLQSPVILFNRTFISTMVMMDESLL
jgi:hypothetical protein